MPKDNRPYVIMQMSASLDGRIAFGPGLTMFDKHPADDLLHDAGPLWKKVTDSINMEWHPQGTMWGSGTFLHENAPLQELPAFAGDAQALYVIFYRKKYSPPRRPGTFWWMVKDDAGVDTNQPRIRVVTSCIWFPAPHPWSIWPFFVGNAYHILSAGRSMQIWRRH